MKNGLSNIRKLFPFSPAKEGPFSGTGYTTYSGRALMRDFGGAIAAEAATVKKQTEAALQSVQGAFDDVSASVPNVKLGVSTAHSLDVDANSQLSTGTAAKTMASALMQVMSDNVKLSLDPRSNEAVLNFSDSGRRSLRRTA